MRNYIMLIARVFACEWAAEQAVEGRNQTDFTHQGLACIGAWPEGRSVAARAHGACAMAGPRLTESTVQRPADVKERIWRRFPSWLWRAGEHRRKKRRRRKR